MNIKSKFSFFLFVAIVAIQSTSVLIAQNGRTDHDVTVGDFKVRMLQDAQFYLKSSLLTGIEQSDAIKLLGGKDSSWTPANAYLVRMPNRIVLVDAGVGKYPGEDSGHLIEHLKQAGVEPAQVDLILITHFHFDHIGGLVTPEGKMMFPNAVVRASQVENDFWMRDSLQIPQNLRSRAAQIKAVFAPYISAKLYKPFALNEELGEGIRAFPAYGHTPGHSVYSFSSKGAELWCIGDLIHFNAVQFKHPLAAMMFDSDQKTAIASRLDFFSRAAASHIIIAGAHLPEMFRLEKEGDSFKTTPVTH